MWPNGTCRVEEGRYSRCIEFDDANFQASRKTEQELILERYGEMYSAFDDRVDIKVSIMSRMVDDAQWKRSMFLPMADDDERGNVYRAEINALIESKVVETRQNVVRNRFITLIVNAPTREQAEPALSRATEAAIRHLKSMDVRSRELTGVERLNLINSITNPSDLPGSVSYDDLKVTPGLITLDLVAPPDFTRNGAPSTSCSWGGCHGVSLYMQKYGKTVRSDMVSTIAEIPVNQVITLGINAWDQAEAQETIEHYVTDMKSTKRNYILKHSQKVYTTDEMVPDLIQDALSNSIELRDDLVHRDQKYWSFSMTVLTWADDEEALGANVEEIKSAARRFNCRLEPLRGLQMHGFQDALPTGSNRLPDDYRYNMTTYAMANHIPFTSVELDQPGGMYMGQNQISRNFIFYDRKNSLSPNGFILGRPGRGKSVTSKLTIINTLLSDPDSEVVVIDPEREYIGLAEEFDGEVIKISGNSPTHVNPFDLAIDKEDEGIATKVDAVLSMVEEMCKGLTAIQQTLVDRACTQVYQKYFETRDDADLPTLTDFYECLKDQPEDDGRVLATTIERFVTGQAKTFAHRTNVDTSKRFVVYDILELSDNLKGLGLMILLDATWQRIVRNRDRGVRTWLFIDEMQLLVKNAYAVDYLDTLWSRARKYGAIPTGITQNIERLVKNEKTRLMLANSDFLVLLGQSSSDSEQLGNILKLSSQQIGYIRTASAGDGLLVADGKIVPFENRLITDSRLYRLVTTKIEDINEIKSLAGAR